MKKNINYYSVVILSIFSASFVMTNALSVNSSLNIDRGAPSAGPSITYEEDWIINGTTAKRDFVIDDWGHDIYGNNYASGAYLEDASTLYYRDYEDQLRTLDDWTISNNRLHGEDHYTLIVENLEINKNYNDIYLTAGFYDRSAETIHYYYYGLGSLIIPSTTDHSGEVMPTISYSLEDNFYVVNSSAYLGVYIEDWGMKSDGTPYNFTDFSKKLSTISYYDEQGNKQYFNTWMLVSSEYIIGADQYFDYMLVIDNLSGKRSYNNITIDLAFQGHKDIDNYDSYDHLIIGGDNSLYFNTY